MTDMIGLGYLATPYTKYPAGIEQAWIDACSLTARLMVTGLCCYSPIAHTHPLAIHGRLDPLDHSIWLPFDEVMMARADALIVARMPSWETSKGIAYEVDFFERAGKPIFDLDPLSLTLVRRSPTRGADGRKAGQESGQEARTAPRVLPEASPRTSSGRTGNG